MIELRTLGGMDVRSSGDESSLPLSVQPKRLALLVYLALDDATGFRRRDSAVAYFWPELDTPHARGALRQALHSLRRLLGDEAIVVRGEEEIGVRRDAVRCDAVSFRECTEAGRHDEALTLYRGDFLDGFFAADVAPEFEQWVEGTRLGSEERLVAGVRPQDRRGSRGRVGPRPSRIAPGIRRRELRRAPDCLPGRDR